MPSIYRILKYSFNTQEQLDIQLNKSLAEGIYDVNVEEEMKRHD